MGRFRTICKDNEPKDFNSYYTKKKGLNTYTFLKTTQNVCYNNAVNNEIKLGNECFNKKIIYYKSYDDLINLSKISSLLDPSCSECADVPVNLANGLQSELCYEELYEEGCEKTEKNNNCCCKKCMKIPIINECQEKTGKMFPYGHFNNAIKNPSVKIHSLQHIESIDACEEKLTCPSYIYCQCPPGYTDCKCCNYSITNPITNTENIKYYQNSVEHCDDDDENTTNSDLMQLYEMKNEHNEKEKRLAEKAVSIYSKFGNNNTKNII